jgi:hypothetical protein
MPRSSIASTRQDCFAVKNNKSFAKTTLTTAVIKVVSAFAATKSQT